MSKIFECIPNISEGRDAKVVLACVRSVSEVEGITLLNYTSDINHNRSVITFMGDAKAIEEASISLARATTELIDLRKHSGEHPRVGALDVLPIVPLKNASEEEAVELSIKIAKRIADECGVPTYLYENSASAPHRRNLADIRRGGFEGLCEKQKDKDWLPDFGSGYHESAGVVVVGARFFLIAYNFDLKTDDLNIAKAIAKKIRQSSGGFEGV